MSYKNYLIVLPLIVVSCTSNPNIDTTPTDNNSQLKSTDSLSLCQKTEVAVVACQIDEPQGRLLAICHSNEINNTNVTNDGPKVHYRLGTLSNIDSSKAFTKHNPLLRWVDTSAYTTYFGFKQNNKYYSVGVPQETDGAKVFIEIFDEKGQALSGLSCISNSFEHKMLTSPAILDLSDEDVYQQGGHFPYDYDTNR